MRACFTVFLMSIDSSISTHLNTLKKLRNSMELLSKIILLTAHYKKLLSNLLLKHLEEMESE
jgi:hypothetical protein